MTAVTFTECSYYESGRACHEPPVWQCKMGGREFAFCERHRQPEFHPPDVHEKLSVPGPRGLGRLSRAVKGKSQ